MTRHNDTEDDESKVVNGTKTVTRRGALRAGVGVVVAAVAGASTTGTAAAQSALDGSGTGSDPYLIDTAGDLDAVRDDLTAHYKLTSDIDASSIDNWDPIGAYDPGTSTYTGFAGSINGDGHVITGLTINRPDAAGVGLFAYVDGGEITGLTVSGATVTGLDNVGVIVGDTWEATISNVTVGDATVAGRDRVGGIAGEADATTIGTVCVTGEVRGAATNSANHGGVAGYLTTPSTVTDASVTVTVGAGTGNAPGNAGGVAGTAAGHINTVRADVDITANGDVGGIAGVVNAGPTSSSNPGVIEYASATGAVTNTAGTATGGVVGRTDDADTASTVRDVYSHVTVSNTSGSGLAETAGIVAHPASGAVIERAYHAAGTVGAADGAVGGAIGDTTTGAAVSGVYVENGSVEGTAVDEGATGVTRVTTSSMTGSDAKISMGALDFSATWDTVTADYPVLASTPSLSCAAADGEWGGGDEVVAGGVGGDGGTSARYVPWWLAVVAAGVAVVKSAGGEE